MAICDNMRRDLSKYCLLERILTPDSDGFIYTHEARTTGVYHTNGTNGFGDIGSTSINESKATLVVLGDIQILFDGQKMAFRKLFTSEYGVTTLGEWISV